MSSNNTQLTQPNGYKTDRMVFSEPIAGSIPGSTVKYQRIMISTTNKDGTIGELILPTDKLFSFGVSENKNPEGVVNGHVLPVCLWDRENPTKEQKVWVETFNQIVEKCKDHLVENKVAIKQFSLERSDLKKLNPLYWKHDKETGKRVEGMGPTLYGKLIASKKHNKILTQFVDENDKELEPMELLGKYCMVRCAVKIESIFIGNKISLQVKIREAIVELIDQGMKRLLPRPKASSRMLSNTNPLESVESDDESDSDVGSIKDDEEDEHEPEPEPEPKPVKKKKLKRKVKKVGGD